MLIRFTVEGTKYELDIMRLMNTEAILIKKMTGLTIQGMYEGMDKGDPEALTALVWLAKKRAGEPVKFQELEFDTFEVAQSLEADEPEEDPDLSPLDGSTGQTSSGEPEN